MSRGVDGHIGRAVKLKFVGVVRAGGCTPDVDFSVGSVKGAAALDNGPRQRVHIREVGHSSPGNKLSTSATDSATNNDAFLGVSNIRLALRGNSGRRISVGWWLLLRASRKCGPHHKQQSETRKANSSSHLLLLFFYGHDDSRGLHRRFERMPSFALRRANT